MLEFDDYPYEFGLNITPSTITNQRVAGGISSSSEGLSIYSQFNLGSDDQYNSSASSIQTPVTPYDYLEEELFGKMSDQESSPDTSPYPYPEEYNYLNNSMCEGEQSGLACNCNCNPNLYNFNANPNYYYPDQKMDVSSIPSSYYEYLASPVIMPEDSLYVKYEDYPYPIQTIAPPPLSSVHNSTNYVKQQPQTQRPSAPVQRPIVQSNSATTISNRNWNQSSNAICRSNTNDWSSNSRDNHRRFAWSQELHESFVRAYEMLGETATPKKIMLAMKAAGAKMEGVTRLKVASHFQKYLQKIGRKGCPGKKKAGNTLVHSFSAPNLSAFRSSVDPSADKKSTSEQVKSIPSTVVRMPPPSS